MINNDKLEKNRLLFYSGIAGILAPLISSITIYVAINKAHLWFHWRHNWLSDLGVHAESETYFNSGLIVSGALMILFSLGIYHFLKGNIVFKIGNATLFIGSISLMMIGVFTEDYDPTHYIVSVSFFSFMILTALVLGVGFILKRDWLGILLVASSFLAGLMWAIPWNTTAGAIPEATSVAFLSLPIMVLGYKMIRSA